MPFRNIRTFPRYAGRGLDPLPYESAICTLWRFQWRNAFATDALNRACTEGPIQGKKNFLSKEEDRNKFSSITGWTIPSDNEKFFSTNKCWIAPRFRYCPLCLELGFHSFLHQFLGIDICPWHRIPLSDRCEICGELLPQYGLSADFFVSEYGCKKGHPISGIEPSLNLDDILRDQTNEIERYFGPIYRWIVDSKEVTEYYLMLLEVSDERDGRLGAWGTTNELVRDLCMLSRELPAPMSAPKKRRYTCIYWRCMCYQQDIQHITDSGPAVEFSYRDVLVCLRDWIVKTRKITEGALSELLDFPNPNVSDYDPYVLAFLSMRAQIEGCYFDMWRVDIEFAKIESAKKYWRNWFRSKQDGSDYLKMAFLGVFCAWFLKIRTVRNQDVKALLYFSGWEFKDPVSYFAEFRNTGRRDAEGVLIFPDIPSLFEFVFPRLFSLPTGFFFWRIDVNADNAVDVVDDIFEWNREMTDPLGEWIMRGMLPNFEEISLFLGHKIHIQNSPDTAEIASELGKFTLWCDQLFQSTPWNISSEQLNQYTFFLMRGYVSKRCLMRHSVSEQSFRQMLAIMCDRPTLSISDAVSVINQYLEFIWILDREKFKNGPLNLKSPFRKSDSSVVIALNELIVSWFEVDREIHGEGALALIIALLLETQWNLSKVLRIKVQELRGDLNNVDSNSNECLSILDQTLCIHRYCSQATSMRLKHYLSSADRYELSQDDESLLFSFFSERISLDNDLNSYLFSRIRLVFSSRIDTNYSNTKRARSSPFRVIGHFTNTEVVVKFFLDEDLDSWPVTFFLRADGTCGYLL